MEAGSCPSIAKVDVSNIWKELLNLHILDTLIELLYKSTNTITAVAPFLFCTVVECIKWILLFLLMEQVEVEYDGKITPKIQYTVTEPNSTYPKMEKFLGLTSAKATELIDSKIFEENKTLLKVWKKGQGKKTEYFVEAAV